MLTHAAGGREVHAGLVAEDAAAFVHLHVGNMNRVLREDENADKIKSKTENRKKSENQTTRGGDKKTSTTQRYYTVAAAAAAAKHTGRWEAAQNVSRKKKKNDVSTTTTAVVPSRCAINTRAHTQYKKHQKHQKSQKITKTHTGTRKKQNERYHKQKHCKKQEK